MNKLTQKELDYLAVQGIDRRINELNLEYQIAETGEQQAMIKNIKDYQNVKKSILKGYE